MRIRAAQSSEAEALGAVAWKAKASWGYSELQLQAWRESLTPSVESIREQPTYLAELENELAGFYQLNVSAEPVELGQLWVHPKFMRRGLGRALLVHATECAARLGIPSVFIDSDPHAEPFYAAFGAVRIGTLPAPIEGQPNRVRPQLRLSTAQPNPSIERTSSSGLRPLPAAAHVKR
jgi:GNAT superfamily N-acetyltransferase